MPPFTFQDRIEKQDRRAAAMRLVAQIADADPSFLTELRDAIADVISNGNTKKPIGPATAASTPVETEGKLSGNAQIIRYFRSRSNEWLTVDQIADATKLKKNTAAHIVYHAHRDLYESQESKDGSRGKQFRLRQG